MSKDNFNMADLSAALNDEDRAGLALENKPQNLTDQYSTFLESLSSTVRKRVEVLREIKSQHDELDAKFSEERAALDAKYQKLHQALYTKRHEIVNGVVEAEVEAANDQEGAKAAEEKGIPDFWLVAMKNNEVLAEVITESDEGALKYLKDIKWCVMEDSKGFKLEFFFDPNPYFKNTVLTKTYVDAGCILLKAIGTEIEWYPGKWLTRTLIKEKLVPNTKIGDGESFFNFFNPPQVPEDDEDIDDDDDDAEELENQMDEDYEIGLTIRDQIIRHAVSWFTGEAIQELEDGLDDDDDSQADNIDEDDDDDKEMEVEEEDDEGKTEKK